MSDDPVPDIYFSRDFPVLKVIAQWEAAGRSDGHLRPEVIAEQTHLPVEQVNQSLGRLVQGRLIDAADTIDQGEYYMVRRLTHEGLRESGLWAKETDLADGIRIVLEAEIKAASGDDKRRALLKQVLDAAGDLGTSFLAKLAAELMKGIH